MQENQDNNKSEHDDEVVKEELASSETAQEQPNEPQPAQQKQKSKALMNTIKIILILFVLGGGAYFVYDHFLSQNTNEEVIAIAPDYAQVQAYVQQNNLDIDVVENIVYHATNGTDTAIAGSAVTYWVELIGLDSNGALTSVIVKDVSADESMPQNEMVANLRDNTINFYDKNVDAVTVDVIVTFCDQTSTFSYHVIQQNVSNSNLSLLVNTFTGLPHDFGPESMYYGMEEEAGHALVDMIAGASKDGYSLSVASDYRSYSLQQSLYNGAVARLGPNQQDTARPGFSEHQTGWAADLTWAAAGYGLSTRMEDDAEYQWLQENSYKYGFVLRYPKGATDITGYYYEPWHYRYIGVELATQYHESGMETLDEFLSIPR